MPCPICNKKSVKKYTPFCSNHCANVDLGKWLNGSYSVPVVEDDDLPEDNDNEDQSATSY